MSMGNIWEEFDDMTSDWDEDDDRDMDLDDDLFPDSRRIMTMDLDLDQSRRIDGVTFAGEPLTLNLCAEYEYERDYVNGEHVPWSEIKIQPRIKHRAGVKVSRFSILTEDVATSGREVKIKTRRTLRKDPGTTEKHKAVCRILDQCARITANARNDGLCQCLTCTRAFATLTTEDLRLARSLGILRKNRGTRWTYDRWTGTIEFTPKITFRRPTPLTPPSWFRPLPDPPRPDLDEVLTVRVNLRVLDPTLAKNVRLALRLFGRYVLPSRVCYGRCVGGSCLCTWMPTLERAVDKNLLPIEFETRLERLKYARKILVSATEMRVYLPKYETTAEARYHAMRERMGQGEFNSIQYGEALAPFKFSTDTRTVQGQAGDRVALWHYGRGQTTIAARTPRKDVPKVQIVHRTVKGRRKIPHRPLHALTRPRPRTGPARHAQSHGLGPERSVGVEKGEDMAGAFALSSSCPRSIS